MYFSRSIDNIDDELDYVDEDRRITYEVDINPLTALALIKTGRAHIDILQMYAREFNSYFASGIEIWGRKIYCRFLPASSTLEETNFELEIYSNTLTHADYNNILEEACIVATQLYNVFPGVIGAGPDIDMY